MNISTIKSSLSARYAPSDEIAVAWWDKEWFEQMLGRKLSRDEWDAVLSAAEKVLEFSDLGDRMTDAAENTIYELERLETNNRKTRKGRK